MTNTQDTQFRDQRELHRSLHLRQGLVQRFKLAHAQAPDEFPAVQPG